MKVSIITIVYNNKDFITDCIQSVLNQTYPDIEHLVIDGGSIDGTQQKIKEFADQLEYYISEKDEGLYNALNKGIRKATGDIIGILHSDDIFYENTTVEKIVNAFQASGADLVYANGMYVNREDPTKIRRVYKSKPYKKTYLDYGWIPLHTTIYVKTAVFKNYGMYDEDYAIASDYEISLRWFKNTNIKTHFLNEWVVKMRLGGKSTTVALQKKKSSEDLEIIKEHGLLGKFTLACKIGRKIPQYLKPRLQPFFFSKL